MDQILESVATVGVMMIRELYEHRSGLQRGGNPTLLPLDEAITRPGYISVFAYPPEAQAMIKANGGTFGLRGVPLSASVIYLDFDDNDPAADAAETKLQEMGLGYERHFTGNRGFHFHIRCLAVSRLDLAYRVKAWVASNFPGADPSLYKTSGVIRTPGTFHHKSPGKTKHLVSSGEGKLLDLMAADIVTQIPRYVSLDTDTDAAAALDRLWLEPAYSGGRNQEIYRRAFLCRMSGMLLEDAEEALQIFNELMVNPPLPTSEVISATRSAFRE